MSAALIRQTAGAVPAAAWAFWAFIVGAFVALSPWPTCGWMVLCWTLACSWVVLGGYDDARRIAWRRRVWLLWVISTLAGLAKLGVSP